MNLLSNGINAGKSTVSQRIVKLIFLSSFIFFLMFIVRNYFHSGDPWQQGDWLINSINVPVRRSFTGDLFIWVSGRTGLELLSLVFLTQVLLTIFLYVSALKLILSNV